MRKSLFFFLLLLCFSLTTFAHQITVKGLVLDKESGNPIIGATVNVANSNQVTITDLDGKYVLQQVCQGAVVNINYVGYRSSYFKAESDVKLYRTLLSEDLAEAYMGENQTGSVETIGSEMIENRPISSVTDALQGAISGLTVSSSSGEPGSFSKYKIRGNSTFYSKGDLVMIDGMPGDINHVAPQDIESISVLKDAASTAIYGARAAEGVILITTKKAQSDKLRLEYSGNISFNTPTRLPESNSAYDHALLANLAYSSIGRTAPFSQQAFEAIKDPNILSLPTKDGVLYTADNDWIDLMMDHSFQENHNLTLSKASDRLNYLFSASWLDQDGMYSEYGPDNYDRINLRSNVSIDIIKDKLVFDSRINFTHGNRQAYQGLKNTSITEMILTQYGPNMPVYDEDGNYAHYKEPFQVPLDNPIEALREGGRNSFKNRKTEGVFSLSYKPLKGLVVKGVFGASFNNNDMIRQYGAHGEKVTQYTDFNSVDTYNSVLKEFEALNVLELGYINTEDHSYSLTSKLLAEYHKVLNEKHDFTVLVGGSHERNKYNINTFGYRQIGYSFNGYNYGRDSEETLLSGFMRLNYAYKAKYLFGASFRADASSYDLGQGSLGKEDWGYFPSLSLGWRIIEENFMKNQNLFSNMKLRLSWGRLGKLNALGLYQYIEQNIPDERDIYSLYKTYSGRPDSKVYLSNKDRWETVDMTNIALDFSILNNRLSFTGEYFIKRNKEMLLYYSDPLPGNDQTLIRSYHADLKVKGWEIALLWNDRISDFRYGVNFNLSDQKDELVGFDKNYYGLFPGVNIMLKGQPMYSIIGYETDGYYSTQEEVNHSGLVNKATIAPGDIKYIDQDGDGEITMSNDLKYLGDTNPRLVFGLGFNAEWKNFDFKALFQGVGKRSFYLDNALMSPFTMNFNNFSYKMHNDYWTPENTNAALPKRVDDRISEHWVQNAAYLRLKNLQLGYTLPKTYSSKVGLEKIHIYFSGENLFELTNFNENFDPELTVTSGVMYPIMRRFSFGLNLTL